MRPRGGRDPSVAPRGEQRGEWGAASSQPCPEYQITLFRGFLAGLLRLKIKTYSRDISLAWTESQLDFSYGSLSALTAEL